MTRHPTGPTSRFWATLLILAVVLLPAQSAWARRVALVVGNADYAAAGVLTNPRSDATLVSGALKRAGFDTVEVKTNLSVAAFREALRTFQTAADGAEVALVYYAGHGIEAKGVNWLVPVDASLADERALPYEAISLDLVLEAVGGAKVRVVMLDACRNSPFGRTWTAGTRSVQRGLARVESDDVLVVYAAAPGQQAADGDGNSPFAKAVAERLPQAGAPIQLLGGLIRDDVMAATGNQQRPFVSASISGVPFYLVPGAAAPATPRAVPADNTAAETAVWQSAERVGSSAAYQAYLQQYPNGAYAGVARAAMAKLEAETTAAPPAVTAATTPPNLITARQLMAGGDCAGAEPGFAAFIAAEPRGPRTPEVFYWLAKCQRNRGANDAAVKSYFAALSGVPQTPWAPDAVVEMGRALLDLDRRMDACLAMRQLVARYPNAPPEVATRADALRKAAACSGDEVLPQLRPAGPRPMGGRRPAPAAGGLRR